MRNEPEVSICIATHHGRAQELAVALDSVLAEIDDTAAGCVEVCVSDNASQDGTEAIVKERQRRAPGLIRYRRNAENLGASRNILLVAAMARGQATWLLGSDDALEPGAIRTVLAALRSDDAIAGLTIDRRLYENDLTEPSAIIDVARPALNGVTRLAGHEALNALGLHASFISAHIIRTAIWREARARIGMARLEGSLYPHVWVMVSAWLGGREWLWEPRAVLRVRLNNVALADSTQRSVDGLLARAVRDQRVLWSTLGDRSNARRQLTRFHEQMLPSGHRDALAFHRLSLPERDRRETLALLVSCLKAFWWSKRFWCESLPALVLMICARPADGEQLSAARELVRTVRLRTTGARPECPATMTPSQVTRLPFVIANLGPEPLRSRPGTPLTVAARWADAATGAPIAVSERAGLPGGLAVGARREVTLATIAPPESGTYTLTVSALIEGIGWIEHGAWNTTVTVSSRSAEDLP